MKGQVTDIASLIHVWPVFSAKMISDASGLQEREARRRLDQLVEGGVLARWSQSDDRLPACYYLTGEK